MVRVIYKIAETDGELRGHFAVRRAVFVEEQGIFQETDVDEHDTHAVHLIAVEKDSGAVVGAVRCYEDENGTWFGGRLAVLKDARFYSVAVGPRLCKLAEKVVAQHGSRRFLAYIQLQNIPFFERLGWKKVGELVIHCGQPHQTMQASMKHAAPIHQKGEVHSIQP